MRFGPAFVIVLALGSGRLPAQTTDSANPAPLARKSSGSCFRGRPEPICHSFWLTEFGLAHRVGTRGGGAETTVQFELGGMINRGPRRAIGIAAFAQANDDASGIGIRPRLRTWLGPTASLDIAPGIVVGGSGGFSGQVALNFADYAALTSNLLVFKDRGDVDRTRVLLQLGAKLGSRPGVFAALATPIVVLLAVAVACGNGGCGWGI